MDKSLTVLSLIEELERVNIESGDLPCMLWDSDNEEYRPALRGIVNLDRGFVDLSFL